MLIEFHVPLFSCADDVSIILPVIVIVIFAPVCKPPLMALNAVDIFV